MHKTSADLILGRVSNGPTFTQHWITVFTGSRDSRLYLQHDKQDTSTLNADLMLGQYLRRWANVKPALGRRLIDAGYEASKRPLFSLVDGHEALKRPLFCFVTSLDQIFPAAINSCNCLLVK